MSGGLAKRFKGGATHVGAKLGELRNTAWIGPRPVVAKEAVVQIVRGIGSNVDGQAGHEKPRLLRAHGKGCGCAQSVPREETADVDLVGGGANQLVVAVAAIEMEL